MARKDDSYYKKKFPRGVKCPECHCPDLRVYGTIKEGDRIKRYRACRACGFHPIITYETVRPEK